VNPKFRKYYSLEEIFVMLYSICLLVKRVPDKHNYLVS